MDATTDAAEFKSPCPMGMDTVWGFLARTEPWIILTADDPIADLLEDQDRAAVLADREGLECITVAAPMPLQQRGYQRVIAFPEALLRELYLPIP